MSSAIDALLDRRRKWRQYLTEPPIQPVGQSGTAVATVQGAGMPAIVRRGTETFRKDTAECIDILLDETVRNRHWLERLEQGPTPVPLVLPEEVEGDLRYLQHEAASVRMELGGEEGLRARVVRLEYQMGQDPHAHEGLLMGLTVAAALVSSVSALVSVGALVWTWGGGA